MIGRFIPREELDQLITTRMYREGYRDGMAAYKENDTVEALIYGMDYYEQRAAIGENFIYDRGVADALDARIVAMRQERKGSR